MALRRPIPHESWYAISGYFYLYGHYYAAEVMEHLTPAEQVRYRGRLAREVLRLQDEDGSTWDYPLMGYARPYGTAFAVLTLTRTLGRE